MLIWTGITGNFFVSVSYVDRLCSEHVVIFTCLDFFIHGLWKTVCKFDFKYFRAYITQGYM